jgi:multidrug efflux pump subunit AcrA (membrane-fusion protein)
VQTPPAPINKEEEEDMKEDVKEEEKEEEVEEIRRQVQSRPPCSPPSKWFVRRMRDGGLRAINLKQTNAAIESRVGKISRDFVANEAADRQLLAAERQAMAKLHANRTTDATAREAARLAMVQATRRAREAAARKSRRQRGAGRSRQPLWTLQR